MEGSGNKGLFSSVPLRVRWQIYAEIFSTIGFGYLLIVITAYLPQVNVGAGTIGLILGIQGIVLILAGIPLGILSDRRGRKWIIVIGSLMLPPTIIVFAL